MNTADGDRLINFVRIARGLERDGLYNAAKLFWAAVFSAEVRESGQRGIPINPEERDREIETAIVRLKAAGAESEFLAALDAGRRAALENRTIPRSEIPDVFVCRDCGEIFVGEPPAQCSTCGARALTFRAFPPVYYLEPLQPQQVLAALASAPDEITKIVQGLTEDEMAWSPAPGKWSIRDVLHHLLVAQGLLAGRVEKLLAEENPSLNAVAAWTIRSDDALTGQEVMDRFRASREATVAHLQSISLPDWFRTGQHEEFGEVSLLQQASYFAKHERHHLPRMESTRRRVALRRQEAVTGG